MKNYIFYTQQGYTYDNKHDEANNMQILGHGEGECVLEAFKYFKEQQSYIHKQAFMNVIALQTIGDPILNLEL